MAELHYFPMYASDWLAGQATTLMTLEQEGAFLRLLLHSWLSAGVPCSIPDDDDALATLSKLGKRWKVAGAFVRAQFEPVEEYPGNLRNPKLWEVFVEQTEKHSRRVIAGALGGKARAKRKQKPSNAIAMLKQKASKPATSMLKQPESELDTETTKTTTPSADAERPKTWVTEGSEWWAINVGSINAPRFGKALKDCVVQHGWPEVFDALKCYVEDAKGRGRPPKPEYCASEIVKWVEWAGMPATDGEGLLTPRGRAIVGMQ